MTGRTGLSREEFIERVSGTGRDGLALLGVGTATAQGVAGAFATLAADLIEWGDPPAPAPNYREYRPDLNWQEADEVDVEDLRAAGDFHDRLVAAKHLEEKAAVNGPTLAAHLHYDHGQARRLPNTKPRLVALHEKLHEEGR